MSKQQRNDCGRQHRLRKESALPTPRSEAATKRGVENEIDGERRKKARDSPELEH